MFFRRRNFSGGWAAVFFLVLLWACSQPGSDETLTAGHRTASIEAAEAGPFQTPETSISPAKASPPPVPKPREPTSTPDVTQTPTFSPTASPVPVTRFAVIGDYGLAGVPERDVANLIKSWNPDLIITTGDNNYDDGFAETIDENIGQYFHAFIYPYVGQYGEGADVNRFFPVLGNHDLNTNAARPYLDYFVLPGNERYYDFIWGSVHFFAINSDSREPDGVGRTSIQAQWLQEKLATSTSPWKIVYMHHPPYSSSEDGSILWAQWPYKDWGATAVLAGHSHVYERIEVDEFPYFVNGLGGGPVYRFHNPVPGSAVRFRDDYGAMLVEATPDQITFQFVTRQNQVIDTYVIVKND